VKETAYQFQIQQLLEFQQGMGMNENIENFANTFSTRGYCKHGSLKRMSGTRITNLLLEPRLHSLPREMSGILRMKKEGAPAAWYLQGRRDRCKALFHHPLVVLACGNGQIVVPLGAKTQQTNKSNRAFECN
jgi:hypothetical protein